ncbi:MULTISPECIES: hypothetical protein [unclassified Diaminobutyricimonas]|uniref:hypothetical protein n=1 Tax=unclassified Diaminobutyricimonas TaxID=2643261 RepID=UPI0012F4A664|nr:MULTISPECIES: hypothetical protein [unclassified Diaminobutyricimonas]
MKKSLVLTASTFVVGATLVGGSAFAATGLLAPQEQKPVSITDVAVPTAERELAASAEGAADVATKATTDQAQAEAAAAGAVAAETTGSVRSQEVAVVPREVAKIASDKGSETGETISEWAKTQANQPVNAEAEAGVEVGVEVEVGDVTVDTEASADVTAEVRGGNR